MSHVIRVESEPDEAAVRRRARRRHAPTELDWTQKRCFRFVFLIDQGRKYSAVLGRGTRSRA